MYYLVNVANYTGNSFGTTIYGKTLESAVKKAARHLVRPKDQRTMRIEPTDNPSLWHVYDRDNYAGDVTILMKQEA